MASRIRNLENALNDASTESQSGGHAEAISTEPVSHRSPAQRHDLNETGVLVQKGTSSHYFNDVLLSRALAEVSPNNVAKEITRRVAKLAYRKKALHQL